MKISASIYSSKENDLKSLVKKLDAHKIDYFHIDCNDDLGVFDDISTIREVSNTPIDLHIISPGPEKFFPFIKQHQIEQVTFQYEDLHRKLEVPGDIGSKLGLSITAGTPLDVFEGYKDRFSFILFMATTPGQSGGRFNKETFRNIRKFKKRFPGAKIHVDGGVNAELSFILRNMGVRLAVVGSYLFKSAYVGASLLNLKSDDIKSHYLVKEFMLTENLPTLPMSGNGFHEVLLSIEKHNMGFTMVVDEDNRLEGIITNADVRRGLINNFNDFSNIKIDNIINRNPVFIKENKTVSELLHLVKNLSFPLLYLPVTDNRKHVVGAITFNNLIKGES